jgi:hypothetical protein
MQVQFLRLESPKDMWHKAARELERFESDPSVDNAFNFLVSIYHIRDYAKAAGLDVAVLDSNSDFQLCRLACNSGKHFNLTGHTATAAASRGFETHADIGHEGHDEYAVVADGERIPILELGRRVLPWLKSWLRM